MPSEVVVPREGLLTVAACDNNFADKGLLLGVHCLVPGEILLPEKRQSTALNLALERAILCLGVIFTVVTAEEVSLH